LTAITTRIGTSGECNLGAGRPAAAAAAVERLVAAFPDRLQAYHEGAVRLLRCAALAETGNGAPLLAGPAVPSEGPNSTAGQASSGTETEKYRQRAHELIAKAREAHQRTPDSVDHFAWFLLTCEDESFRDSPQALELAKTVVTDVPERGGAWLTLTLAEYRNGDWQAADEADQNSIKFSPGAKANAYDWALLSMIRAQQGRREDARQWRDKARSWIAANNPQDQDLLRLTAEADELNDTPTQRSAI
jgi:tetratricopeptide (TPR) repeat protein